MDEMKERMKTIIIVIIVVFMIMYQLSIILMIISAFGGLNGACWFRYSQTDSEDLISNVVTTSKTVVLVASGNYKTLTSTAADGTSSVIPDPGSYGQWLNAGSIGGTSFTVNISGDVSLCKSYLPNYDIQSGAADTLSKKIEIPRVEDGRSLPLFFPANSSNWRNLAEIFGGDNIRILVAPAVTTTNNTNASAVTMTNSITRAAITPVDCSVSVNSSLSPLCGRYTPYAGSNYVSSCIPSLVRIVTSCSNYGCAGQSCNTTLELNTTSECRPWCQISNGCTCSGGEETRSKANWENRTIAQVNTQLASCTAAGRQSYIDSNASGYAPQTTAAPINFAYDGTRNFAYSSTLTNYIPSYSSETCSSVTTSNVATYNSTITSNIAGYKFWLTEGQGLVYAKVDPSTSAPLGIGTTLTIASPLRSSATLSMPDTASTGVSAPGKILYSEVVASQSAPQLFQLAYINRAGAPSGNTGGYVLYVSHTKCKRSNGEFKTDVFTDRGKVQYYLVPSSYDLNSLPASQRQTDWPSGFIDFSNGSTKTIDALTESTIMKYGEFNVWLKVLNDPNDYKDSKGQYTIKFQTKEAVGLFTSKVLQPVFDKVNNIIEKTGTNIFKNLTCYQQTNQTKCFNFFLYIKSLLTAYIAFFGFMFLMGKTKLNQKEFIIHVVKVLIVGGLMNGSTFNFCNNNVFPLIMNFTNQMMANFGGYSNAAPFTFLDEVMSKILLNKLTIFQLLALLSFGLTGVMMFLLAIFGIIVFIIGAFQGIATYILAKLILAFLIGTAPLFFTFMLFSSTQSFFQKWVNNVFRYTVEPVIVILGLAVFTKLFSTYLDNVLNFSVCFKCAIPFMIPNIFSIIMPGFPGIFQDIYLFCLFWFGPWGMDARMGLMGLSMPDIIGMTLVAFMCMSYAQLASKITEALTGVQGFGAGETGAEAGMTMFNATKFVAHKGLKVGMFAAKTAAKTAAKGIRKIAKLGGIGGKGGNEKSADDKSGDRVAVINGGKDGANTHDPYADLAAKGSKSDLGAMKPTPPTEKVIAQPGGYNTIQKMQTNPMRGAGSTTGAGDAAGVSAAPGAPSSSGNASSERQERADFYKSKKLGSAKARKSISSSTSAASGSSAESSPPLSKAPPVKKEKMAFDKSHIRGQGPKPPGK